MSPINTGNGKEISIKVLAKILKKNFNYKREIKFDLTKPKNIFKKLLNKTRLKKIGFTSKIGLEEGLIKTKKIL
jgi:GDP-L-fucose synthase